MDNSTFAILLLLAAQAFIVAEVFLPSGGALTALAVITGLAALYFAFQAWFGEHTVLFGIFVFSSLVAPVFTISFAFYLLPRTAMGQRLLLAAPTPDEVKPFAENENHLKQLVGHVGQADTLLAPGGFVLVDGERHHCVTQGGIMIDLGTNVEVVEIQANRLVVRKTQAPSVQRSSIQTADSNESSTEPDVDQDNFENEPEAAPASPETELAMDFEIPESDLEQSNTE